MVSDDLYNTQYLCIDFIHYLLNDYAFLEQYTSFGSVITSQGKLILFLKAYVTRTFQKVLTGVCWILQS